MPGNTVISAGAGSNEYAFEIADGRTRAISVVGLVAGTIEVQHVVDDVWETLTREGVPQVLDSNTNRVLVMGPGEFKLVRSGNTNAVRLDR
jgi:hypothetical protein